jgi:DNA-binding IclR family transcriptional regulator
VTKHYHLSAGLGILARQASQNDIGSLAQPVLRRLAVQTEDTSYVLVREGLRLLCIGREQGSFPIKTLTLEVGQTRPLGVGSGGLALLSFLPQEEIEAIIEANSRWLQDFPSFRPDNLRKLVKQTQRQGYSFVEGLVLPVLHAIAVPVFDENKRPIAALSVTAINDRIYGERALWIASLLREEAQQLSSQLRARSVDA